MHSILANHKFRHLFLAPTIALIGKKLAAVALGLQAQKNWQAIMRGYYRARRLRSAF